MLDAACRFLVYKRGKLLAIATVSIALSGFPWHTTAVAHDATICDIYGCYRVDGNCDLDGCSRAPTDTCNGFGCTDNNHCTSYGCPANSSSIEPLRSPTTCPNGDAGAVLVEFVARGNDWGSVWIDGKAIFSPRSFNRRQTVNLCPGVYRVVFTGINRLDVWAVGYLDIGRTNLVRLAFSREGRVSVSGDPDAWLLDDTTDPIEIWRR